MMRYSVLIIFAVCGWFVGCGPTQVQDAVEVETESRGEWHLPVPTHAYNTREGKTTFLYYCAPCHGEQGRGDGFNAYNLDPKPRDLTDHDFQLERTDEELAAIVRTGGGAAGLSNTMPPWGRTLSDRKIRNLVSFVRSLPDEVEDTDLE